MTHQLQMITVGDDVFVFLPHAEYERLREAAGDDLPSLPSANERGNYPAIETGRAMLARKIIRRRRAVGLTQVELARRAKVRPETLNRIEKAKATPSVPTVTKLDRVLREAEAKQERE